MSEMPVTFHFASPHTVLAQATTAISVRELDWPVSPWGWLLLIGGGALLVAWVIWQYRRDTRDLSRVWTVFLAVLRLSVLAGLLVIALNPQDRTQRTSFRPSRVAVLVDTSLSMRHPIDTEESVSSETRAAAVRRLLEQDQLLEQLRRDHEISVYAFDSTLTGPHHVYPQRDEKVSGTLGSVPDTGAWWSALEPRGVETRLGEALSELIRQAAGRTLSGVVVLTDGGQNAGVDPVTAHDRAVAAKARLITIGVGGTDQPLNVQLADVQSPTDVQLGDNFEIAAFVQGQGLAGKELLVELLATDATSSDSSEVVGDHRITLPSDGAAAEVRFPVQPAAAGKWSYTVRVKPVVQVREFNEQDNQQTLSLNVFDRPTRVLLVAGGPMRDYQFVRNLIHRHKSMDVDVLLQTATVGSSQESSNLLLEFPAQREQLFDYDVVIAFDVDWQLVPGDGILLLKDWVYHEGGGLVLIAGDVNTAQLAMVSGQSTPVQDQLQPLKELYPVVLNSYLAELRFDQTSGQPWPVTFTPEGQRAEFLQLTDDPLTSLARWKEFSGIYRCYPTAGAKARGDGSGPVQRSSRAERVRLPNPSGTAILRPGTDPLPGERGDVAAARGERRRLRPLLDQDHPRSGAGAPPSAEPNAASCCPSRESCSSARQPASAPGCSTASSSRWPPTASNSK